MLAIYADFEHVGLAGTEDILDDFLGRAPIVIRKQIIEAAADHGSGVISNSGWLMKRTTPA